MTPTDDEVDPQSSEMDPNSDDDDVPGSSEIDRNSHGKSDLLEEIFEIWIPL